MDLVLILLFLSMPAGAIALLYLVIKGIVNKGVRFEGGLDKFAAVVAVLGALTFFTLLAIGPIWGP